MSRGGGWDANSTEARPAPSRAEASARIFRRRMGPGPPLQPPPPGPSLETQRRCRGEGAPLWASDTNPSAGAMAPSHTESVRTGRKNIGRHHFQRSKTLTRTRLWEYVFFLERIKNERRSHPKRRTNLQEIPATKHSHNPRLCLWDAWEPEAPSRNPKAVGSCSPVGCRPRQWMGVNHGTPPPTRWVCL